MKYLNSQELRQMFLDFFVEKGHQIEPSAPLVPIDDPTLLWINSGVATLKKYFDGSLTPDNPRITNSQKSIRTNDIDNVGRTARHHTLFEMLGNFSIGDYFKEEAIVWAWEFLTDERWMAIDPNLLYVTVYPEDTDAKRIWREVIGLDEDHIIDEDGNFWDIGEGPSGPNTEIFFDRGEAYMHPETPEAERYPGGENERWLEIWNLVFSQFNHKPDGTYEPLPNKNIDTGMGLERMLSIVQDAPTNYETDLFLPIIKKTEALSGQSYKQEHLKMSFKVIADHSRAVSFAIGDNVLPSNEGRGYVLRRLLRRAMIHGRKLGLTTPFLYKLVDTVGEITADYYPEVVEKAEVIARIIRQEEERFLATLTDGSDQLQQLIDKVNAKGHTQIDGPSAFQLYDTFGFPVELTEELAAEYGLNVDLEGFEHEMAHQKERARQARHSEQSMSVQTDLLAQLSEDSEFVGYDQMEIQATLHHIITSSELVDSVASGTVRLMFDKTPFYAEKGGQVGDSGVITDDQGTEVARVTDTISGPAGQALHVVEVLKPLQVGTCYTLMIDRARRRLINKNHTATHLLHQALKDVLGAHANQAGSLVTDELLRFDFTHFSAVTDDELAEMERQVNQKIWEDMQVQTIDTTIDQAKEMGAMALFGEKYGEHVRVVMAGDDSIELCGGTHIHRTGAIGLFKITAESGIGAGTRRIIAKTSRGAFEYLESRLNVLATTAQLVKAQTLDDVPDRVTALQTQMKHLEHTNESLNAKVANAQASDLFKSTDTVGNLSVIIEQVAAKEMDALRTLADKWKEQQASDILVLGLAVDDKVNLIVAMNDEAINRGLTSGALIKQITPFIQGGGGGRPELAQAGGKNPSGLPEALKAAKAWIANQ